MLISLLTLDGLPQGLLVHRSHRRAEYPRPTGAAPSILSVDVGIRLAATAATTVACCIPPARLAKANLQEARCGQCRQACPSNPGYIPTDILMDTSAWSVGQRCKLRWSLTLVTLVPCE